MSITANSINDTLNLRLNPDGSPQERFPDTKMHPPALPLTSSGIRQIPLSDTVRKMFGKDPSSTSADPSAPSQAEEENTGMSDGLKLFLIIAGVAVGGFIIYKIAKKIELKHAVKSAYKA